MTLATDRPRPHPLRHELDVLQGSWVWYLVLGVLLIVTGFLAMGSPFITELAVVGMISVLLMIGGIGQIVGAFWARRWSGFFGLVLVGILYTLVGLATFRHPVVTIEVMTLVIALSLMIGGIFRIVSALAVRYPHWGWVLANGVISLLLGIMIWRQWPAASLWIIGLFVGIDLIFNGVTWVTVALALRRLVPRASA